MELRERAIAQFDAIIEYVSGKEFPKTTTGIILDDQLAFKMAKLFHLFVEKFPTPNCSTSHFDETEWTEMQWLFNTNNWAVVDGKFLGPEARTTEQIKDSMSLVLLPVGLMYDLQRRGICFDPSYILKVKDQDIDVWQLWANKYQAVILSSPEHKLPAPYMRSGKPENLTIEGYSIRIIEMGWAANHTVQVTIEQINTMPTMSLTSKGHTSYDEAVIWATKTVNALRA